MLICRMITECTAPLHCGCGKNDLLQDMPVARDAFGNWYIPGSSIAGVLRSMAEDPADAGSADLLFGRLGKSDEKRGYASLFWSRDGLLLDYDGVPAQAKCMRGKTVAMTQGPFIRDHVMLDWEGVAAPTGKFDEEIVPEGTRFFLEIAYDPWEGRDDAGDAEDLFLRLCARCASEGLNLGGRAAAGCGHLRSLACECRKFDLGSESGMTGWLNLSDGPLFGAGEGVAVSLPAVEEKRPRDGLQGTMRLSFDVSGPVIVGGGSQAPTDDDSEVPDIVFATTPYVDYSKKSVEHRFVIPGSSLRGVVRHAMHGACAALGSDEAATELTDSVFGKVTRQEAAHGKTVEQGKRGKIIFRDGDMRNVEKRFINHVAIDRFTGGAFESALFNEGPAWKKGMTLEICLEVHGLDGAEAALLFHVLLDMAEGHLPVGGGIGRGCGRLHMESPVKTLSDAAQALFWNGESVRNLEQLAVEWDSSLQEKVKLWKK